MSKKGDVIRLPAGTYLFRPRTDEEMLELEAADRDAGRWCDSAGEPIVHSRQAASRIEIATDATIVSCKNVPWWGWTRRPRGAKLVMLPDGSTFVVVHEG